MLDILGWVEGPGETSRPVKRAALIPLLVGTPYEGGYFAVKFAFTHEFPAAPPKCEYGLIQRDPTQP